MKEIELFIDMLDEKEVNNILSFFNETPPGSRKNTANLKQKKTHIKKVFKSLTPNMIRKRKNGAPDPFYVYINNYKTDIQADTFKEYLFYLNELKDCPPYYRFGILLLQFPDELRANLDRIESNIENQKDPFDFGDQFETIEELKDMLKKSKAFIGENAPENILKSLEPYQKPEYKIKLNECMNELKEYDFLQFFMKLNELEEKYSDDISNAAYILTHPQEEHDFLLLLAIECMYSMLKQQRINAFTDIEEKLDMALSDAKAEEDAMKKILEEKNQELEVQKGKNKELEKTSKRLEKERDYNEKKLEKLEKLYKEELQRLNVSIKEQEKKEVNLINEYENKFNNLQRELEIKNLIETERKEKFQMDFPFTSDWGIICLTDYDLTKELYPELFLVQVENKKDCQQLIENSQVKTIYLLMKGVSTKKFKILKQEAEKNFKYFKTIDFESFKEFIEWIGYMKTMGRTLRIK